MMNIILLNIFLTILSFILFLINFIISKKTNLNPEKIPLNVDSILYARLEPAFSTQFFIISLIFLIFDIEIALLLSLIYMSMNFNPFIIFYSYLF